jgi:hypothetical protein
VAIANGGTGATTRQDAMDALAGSTTSGQYLRGNGSDVVMSTIQVGDVPTLNQNTTGSAATLTTPRAIYGNNFDGSSALTQIIASTYGGTGNGFTKFTGATTAERTYTLPDASSTIVVQGGALGTPSSGTVTNLTGTASININGTVGATTANTGSFTSLAYTTTLTGGTGIVNLGSGQFYKDASGNVGIGTSSPSKKLVVSNAGAAGLELDPFTRSATTGTSLLSYNRNTSAFVRADYDAEQHLFFTSTTERLRIDTSGGLILAGSTAQKATGTTWSNPSDQRLKDNIRDYAKGTTELMQVRVREWEYNGKGGTTEGMKGLGVIADEVMVVLPNTVENYDAKLNADDEETTAIKKFDATEITWLLVKTVQEQQAIITALQADVAALKAQP